MLSAVPHGLREGERCCYGSLTAGLWQPQPVPSLSEPKRGEEGGGTERKKSERSYHNMEPMLLNVSVVEGLQITSSECHKRFHMHTAATFALADENEMVSKLLDRCSPADAKEKLNQ